MTAGRAGSHLLRIRGGRVLGPDGWVQADVVVSDDEVEAVEARPAGPAEAGPHRGPGIDASGLLVAPGLIDLQVNGAFGHDVTADPRAMWSVGSLLPQTGVTAFLPTVVSSPPSAVRRAIDILAAGPPPGYGGAVPLGLHLEGPMLAPARRGAHDEGHLVAPSLDVVEGWSLEAGIRLVTLAPELPGAGDVIEALVARGIVVSAGHSDATTERAVEAFDRAVSMVTHLFNAMSGPHHRAPGLAGAALGDPRPVAGLIADGVHVHPAMVRIAWACRGPGGIALVTDATAAMGAAGATFPLGGSTILRDGDVVRTEGGDLAGSVLPLDRAARNLVAFTGCSPAEALGASSATPAAVLGEARRGRIERGARADLVLLTPALEVVATVVGGRVAFDGRELEAKASR